MKGLIYILSNPSMEGLVKIGHTTKALEERVSELNNATGIPTDFIVEAFFEVEYAKEIEKRIHRSLHKHRVRKRREFFKLSKTEAVRIVQEICNSPGLRNTKMAPKKSPNYRNPRWLTPEKQEFNAIRKELWDTRKATFEKKFLTDPSVSVRKTPNTLICKLKNFLSFSEHDFRNLSYDKDRLNSCYRIVNEMKGHLKKPYSAPGYLLYALHYSIACVRISSAVDFQPERIKLILVELQKEEREIYDMAKQIYENRHQQKVTV